MRKHNALGSPPTFFVSYVAILKRTTPFFILVLIMCIRQILQIGSSGMAIHLFKTDQTRKRWAVMMVGAGRSYVFTRNSFMQNVVMQTDPPMDVFAFTENVTNSSCLINLESMRLLELDSTVRYLDDKYLAGQHQNSISTEDRFVRQHTGAFNLIESYAEQQNVRYDYIFYTRPDILYTIPFNITELEEKLNNVTDGMNGTIFSPECCAWGAWCDQLAAAKYHDFARMIHASREWWSRGDTGIVEVAFRSRGHFANLSKFDLRHMEDYAFLLLRSSVALESCHGSGALNVYWTDNSCNGFAPSFLNSTFETCERLNTSSVCGDPHGTPK